jgi:hypothetical protein
MVLQVIKMDRGGMILLVEKVINYKKMKGR